MKNEFSAFQQDLSVYWIPGQMVLNCWPERFVMRTEATCIISKPITAPVTMDIDQDTALALVSAPKN